ncbi:hypothetical protein KFL_002270200 [Klebsormidium nitens]|uniref:Uncharacterized protein n=1 Tax=Klebsormidium nitens TaxID=105231 RepID=A0A1Y1I9B4_KLENI|nr:hypothetical protein KFL_002270200 [Klebsormidium nitens]|eukprot:GAQ85286.1 hypothetical protein KFL_002270200 [Klebsormidium nitens]
MEGDFQGVANSPELGMIKVVFGETEEFSCPALVGADCSQCNFLGHGTKTVTRTAPEEATSVKQAEGKKFFLQPSLGAKAGARVDQEAYTRRDYHNREKLGGKKCTMQLRFETAPILQLRKILDPSKAAHVQIIAASSNTRQRAAENSVAGPMRQAGESSTSNSPVLKKEVVKKEKRQGPKSTFIETVDLTEDAGEDQDCMMYTVAKRPKLEGVMLQIDLLFTRLQTSQIYLGH